MSIKQEIQKIDEGLLEKILEFAAYATNNTSALKSACVDLGIEQHEGMAFVKVLADLGMNHNTDVCTMKNLYELQNLIKS